MTEIKRESQPEPQAEPQKIESKEESEKVLETVGPILKEEPEPQPESQPELKKELASQELEKSEYHFEMMTELEPAVVSVVEQLKREIESGEYTALLSDDVGGRIPTLILRKIMKTMGPKPPNVYFLASGKKYMPTEKAKPGDFRKAVDYLGSLDFGDKRLLVISQYTYSGETFSNIGKVLTTAGVEKFDFVSLEVEKRERGKRDRKLRGDINKEVPTKDELKKLLGTRLIYGIEVNESASKAPHYHEPLSGVRKKTRKYSPIPETVIKHIEHEGSGKEQFREEELDREYQRIFDFKGSEDMLQVLNDPKRKKEWKKIVKRPLSEEEIKSIKEKIILAREDVSLLVERVIKKVWGENKKEEKND